jgi:DsbC/DsbD-like thiol-disulfide interchange protein/cytochrome c biogenesis protein CcdA
LLIALLLAALSAPAAAQQTHITARLDTESLAPRPGGETALAIAMTPAPTWHGYWLNGGDAGFGMQVTWTLPPGVSIGELAYPVPDTLIVGGLMNHVYEHPYALIAPLTISPTVAPGTRLPIRGEAQWLACTDQICVPERGILTIDLVAGDGAVAAPDRARFDGWRAALPQPLGSVAHYEQAGDRLRIAIPLPRSMAVAAPHLFVATPRVNQPAATQSFGRSGDMLIVETAAGPELKPAGRIAALLRIGPGRGLSFTAEAGPVPPMAHELASAAPTDADAPAIGFTTALIGALIGGLLLNIMPCVFPILSLKALTLARAGGDAGAARAEGVAYTCGAVFACLALGAVLLLLRAGGEAAGWAFQLQNPALVVLLTILMGAITANLAGLFDFASIGIGSRWGGMTGAKGAFATGALAAFVATPCSGPFLGAALGATLVLPPASALAVFGGLGLGLALPFLAIALIPGLRRRLPRPGPWMVRLRRWLAIPMALTALALVWLLSRQVGPTGWAVGIAALILTTLLAGWAGRLQRRGEPAKLPIFLMAALIVPLSLLLPQAMARPAAATDSALGAQPWTAEREAALRAAGKPLFVYFTADWCVTCKVNEAAAIDRADTARAFRDHGVAVLIADWTSADAAITRELAQHGRNSVPLYLWYAPGAAQPELLPQILTPALLADKAAGR